MSVLSKTIQSSLSSISITDYFKGHKKSTNLTNFSFNTIIYNTDGDKAIQNYLVGFFFN